MNLGDLLIILGRAGLNILSCSHEDPRSEPGMTRNRHLITDTCKVYLFVKPFNSVFGKCEVILLAGAFLCPFFRAGYE